LSQWKGLVTASAIALNAGAALTYSARVLEAHAQLQAA